MQAEDEAAIKESIVDTTVGIFVVKKDATSRPEDIGIVLEGLQIMQGMDNAALAAAMLFGLMYVLNLNYPPSITGWKPWTPRRSASASRVTRVTSCLMTAMKCARAAWGMSMPSWRSHRSACVSIVRGYR